MVHSFKERREYRLQKQRSEAEARDLALASDDKAIEFPGRGNEVARAPKFVRERWAAGRSYFHDTKAVERLAGRRGWPVEWVVVMVDKGLLSCPELPWSNTRVKRGVAFPIECPAVDYSSREIVGYHQTYVNWENKSRKYIYVPYCRKWDRPSNFQRLLSQWGIDGGNKLPALPLVLGNPATARVAAIVEGQWDALTLWGALGGLDGVAEDVVIFGIRGVEGVGTFLSYCGAWLRSNEPRVWLMPDNDEAGQIWWDRTALKRTRDWTFMERFVHAKLRVVRSLVPTEFGKDFNDLWKAKQPSAGALRRWMIAEKLL